MLEEDELATRLQDSCDPLNCIDHSQNGAQGKCANYRVNAAVRQWNAFAR